MGGSRTVGGRLADFLHHHFLGLVLTAYALAVVWPGGGLAFQGVDLARIAPVAGGGSIPLPGVLLGAMLFNAALAVDSRELVGVVRRPRLLGAGLLANLLVPLGFVLLSARAATLWHSPQESAQLLTGLALIAAMPVAGSSAAWTQNAGGNLALSLGLVIGSTALSPLTTPLILAAVETLAGGGPGDALRALAGNRAGGFLAAFVVLPTAAGLLAGRLVGPARVARHKPALKAFGLAAVLMLCYVNAAASLPRGAREPDWDFLALAAAATVALCVGAFTAGWVVARCLGAGRPEERSLAYGLGMTNNGSGLVLASALAVPPEALLPLLLYNLVQHLVAGLVCRSADRCRP
jgi:BASS family bile acid:Na+ symporter